MVGIKSWVESTTQYILLLAATASVIFPSIICQTCHYQPGQDEPIIKITKSSEFHFGKPVNVTCIAQENNAYSHKYDSKPTLINWFYGKAEVRKTCQTKSADTSLTCSLVIDSLTSEMLGNYTCKASTSNYHCSKQRFEIDIHGVLPVGTTEAPTNQSIVPGPNATIKPTDYGKNQSASNTTSEDETVQGGVDHSSPVTTIPRSPETHNFLNGNWTSEQNMITVVVSSVISALVVFAIGGFLWFRRRVQCRRDPECLASVNANDLSLEVIPAHEEFSLEDSTRLVRLQEEVKTTNNSNHYETSPEPDEKSVILPLITSVNTDGHSLFTKIRVEFPNKNPLLGTMLCSQSNNSDNFCPERPPKPAKKHSREKQMKCSCMTVPGNPSTMQSNLSSKDSGYGSAESKESISEMPLENKNAWEIQLDELKVLDEVLGKGEFGIVKKGFYRGVEVAVKQSKAAFSRCNKDDLLNEMKMLKQAGRHPNIVSFIGACTQEDNILLITELVSGGSLESLLRSKPRNRGKNQYENVKCRLTELELLQVSLQVALGMQHLEEKKYIHRDLAARNVFIGANKIAKVGDFGLARDVSDGGIYTKTSDGGVPWRWSSLESLKSGVYSSKSDVWSFGILLWEIATYGKLPYPNICTVEDLIDWLSCGNRMLCPRNCSKPRKNPPFPYWKYDKIEVQMENMSEAEVKAEFRFAPSEIHLLGQALRIPETFTCPNGTVASGEEGLLMLLKRFAYPCRLSDMVSRFGRSVPEISLILAEVTDHVVNNQGHLLQDLNQPWLQPHHLDEFARAISQKGAALDNCWGFVDGTIRPICRPGENQRVMYNGHKRVHCLKFQSVVAPNGMIANLFGPVEGKRHDSAMLRMSGLLCQLEQ